MRSERHFRNPFRSRRSHCLLIKAFLSVSRLGKARSAHENGPAKPFLSAKPGCGPTLKDQVGRSQASVGPPTDYTRASQTATACFRRLKSTVGDKKPSSDTTATLHAWLSLGLWRGRRFRPVGLSFMCIPAAISALSEVTKLPAWRSRRTHQWAMLAAVPRIVRRLSRLAHWRACSAVASCGRTSLPPPLPKFAAPTRKP